MLDRFLFKKIDNSALVIFRFFFGLLISAECYGALLTGWVKKTLVDPQFTFSFIGFEWLQPLPGYGMYCYFFLMGTLGICIALGFKYRLSMGSFTILWTGVYLMQKTSYNNHYYLLILIAFLMTLLPAHKNYAIDARQNPEMKSTTMPAYVKWIIVLQLFIVYTYAAIAKIYGDWLDLSIIEVLMQGRANYPIIGNLLQQSQVHVVIGYAGILFDALIIPALLWKPTRSIAFCAAIFFHLFNSIVFQIGIFPYLALAFCVFFFEPQTLKRLFRLKHIEYEGNQIATPQKKQLLYFGFVLYFLVQLSLPLRHHMIPDDVLWTEEGHRMSWRMMLRSRAGSIRFTVIDKANNKRIPIDLDDYLTLKQKRKVAAYPDFTWQFAQYLKKKYAKNGQEIEVYARCRVSINGKPYKSFIDPKVDLANTSWNPYKHHTWILPSKIDTAIEKK